MGFSNDSIYRFAAGLSPKAPSWFLTKSNARVTLFTRLMMLTGPPLLLLPTDSSSTASSWR